MSEIESRIETGDMNGPLKGPDEAGAGKSPGDGAEKLLVLPVNEDSRKITQTLSNETSLKILELLGKKNLSASDIAGELKIPLTTVKYNLDSLVESELVKVKQIKWSRKGRQVKIYEAMEKLIVLVPSKGFADKLSILSMLQQYIGVIAGAFFAALGIEYFTAYLRARHLIKALPWGPAGLPGAGEYTAPEIPASESAPAPAVMATNNASESDQSGLSPKMSESTEFASHYYAIDEGENASLNSAFAEEPAEEIPVEAAESQEVPEEENAVQELTTEDKVREMPEEEVAAEAPAETPKEDISTETEVAEEAPQEETPMDEGIPAEEAPEMPEAPESAPVVEAEEALPSEDALEGMDSSALDSVPPGTLGTGAGNHLAGQHLFDTLLAHPGVWFLFGCLFVICLLVIREVYYKKKSM